MWVIKDKEIRNAERGAAISLPFCSRMFQSPRRNKKKQDELWNKYVWGKQSLADLSKKTSRSHVWVRKQLDSVPAPTSTVVPHPVVIGTDTTFWGQSYGVCVFRVPAEKENIWWQEVERELMAHYYYGRKILEEKGWTFLAAVVDGRRGLTTVFKDIPVQLCQFHQMKTVTKYLTLRPATLAGQELRAIMLQLPRSNEVEFTKLLVGWKKIGTNSSPKKHASREQNTGTTRTKKSEVHI